MSGPGMHDAYQKGITALPQIKICGITRPEDAIACAALGADAIGLVFYHKSPRYVNLQAAADICSAVRAGIARIGVFVNADIEYMIRTAEACGLTGIQLHGKEEPQTAEQLQKTGLLVIKALYTNKPPLLKEAENYPAIPFLAECAGGELPGGNALAWDWGFALDFTRRYPTVLAGGLSPQNIAGAVDAAKPRAVDVSSGVEAAAGKKDHEKIKTFIDAVRSRTPYPTSRRIF